LICRFLPIAIVLCFYRQFTALCIFSSFATHFLLGSFNGRNNYRPMIRGSALGWRIVCFVIALTEAAIILIYQRLCLHLRSVPSRYVQRLITPKPSYRIFGISSAALLLFQPLLTLHYYFRLHYYYFNPSLRKNQ
jgi:hypothetical protein